MPQKVSLAGYWLKRSFNLGDVGVGGWERGNNDLVPLSCVLSNRNKDNMKTKVLEKRRVETLLVDCPASWSMIMTPLKFPNRWSEAHMMAFARIKTYHHGAAKVSSVGISRPQKSGFDPPRTQLAL